MSSRQYAKLFFRLVLPIVWLIAAFTSWHHPGDEYGLFLFSMLPAAWLTPFLEYTHLREVLSALFTAGAITMVFVGWLMDRLRIWLAIWFPLFAFGVVALAWWAVAEHPNYQRAMAKNGSLTAYVSAATNLSLYLSALFTMAGAFIVRAIAFGRSRLITHAD